MKHYVRSGLFILMILLGSSCKKEIELNSDWKAITIVNGLLSQNDSLHYIRISKAFLGSGDNWSYVTVPDSNLYYDNIDVRLYCRDGLNIVDTLMLDTITVHDKDSGLFYYPDQLLYYTGSELNEDYLYELVIKNKKTGQITSSETNLIHDFPIIEPVGYDINFFPDKMNEILYTVPEGGKRFNLSIWIKVVEVDEFFPENPVIKDIEWVLYTNFITIHDQGGYNLTFSYPASDFYRVLRSNLKVDPKYQRAILGVNFIFTIAASELNNAINAAPYGGSWYTFSPPYSNVENGLGLFSSRYQKTSFTFQIGYWTKKELLENPYTSDLGF